MEKIILTTLSFFLILLFPTTVFGDKVAGNSAVLLSSNSKESPDVFVELEYFQKKKAIKKLMAKYQSPMADSVDAFISVCQKYELNCYLLPSIAILESTFGKFIWPGSYNPFGWGRGYIMFKSWNESIDAVGKGLRENYINKGASSIEQIGKIYSESPTWSPRIRLIMQQFEKEEEKSQL